MSLFGSSPVKHIFDQIRNLGVPSRISDLSEEEQAIPLNFIEEADIYSVESEILNPIKVEVKASKITFNAFLDGIQRTVMLPYRIPLPNGALVPLHIAHIAAGIILREQNTGRIFTDPNLIASRLLLLGPFKGIGEAGKKLDIPEGILMDTDESTFAMPKSKDEWIVCDTTFRGTDEERETRRDGALLGSELFSEGLIRSRAQGRVATLRQRLEFAVLAEFRSRYREDWILVDGPLFFIDKWRLRAAKVLGDKLKESQQFEEKLLKNAVGLIKTNRLRPKNPEKILQIGPNQRSPVFRLTKEVDIKGTKDSPDEEGSYAGAHLTWYTRLRGRAEPPYGLLGLVRIDVHRSTFGIERVDALNPETFMDYRPIVDEITKAVWRERYPAFWRTTDARSASQVYPIDQVEKVLKAMMYPKRLLSHLLLE